MGEKQGKILTGETAEVILAMLPKPASEGMVCVSASSISRSGVWVEFSLRYTG